MPNPEKLILDEDTSVLVLTGAGVSAESGIPTFRAAGGLWESYSIEQVASPGGFARDPALVWRFYSERRRKALTCLPNPGHHALRGLEERLGDRFLLATQNVDDLHRRAGSERLVEMHGNLFLTRCSHCALPPFRDAARSTWGRSCPSAPPAPGPADGACSGPTSSGSGRCWTRATSSASTASWPRRGAWCSWPWAPPAPCGRPREWSAPPAPGAPRTWLVNAEAAENTALFHHFVEGPSGLVLPDLLASA